MTTCPDTVFKVKKELIIAGLIGLALGLIMVGGYFINKSLSREIKSELFNPLIEDYTSGIGSAIKFSDGNNHQLVVLNPSDQTVTNLNNVVLDGKTTPLSIIVILAETTEYTVKADSEGKFESDIVLISGENQIILTSFSPSGVTAEKNINIVVSSFEF